MLITYICILKLYTFIKNNLILIIIKECAMTNYILYGIVLIFLIISAILDIQKTKKAIKIGFKSFSKLMPSLIPLMLFIGIILATLSPETISLILGEKSGIFGVILALVVGSFTFMPSFVAFPLGANLLSHGAGYPQIAAFISSLMAVGFMSIGLEIQYFGKKSAILRNISGVIASIIFSIIVWRVM